VQAAARFPELNPHPTSPAGSGIGATEPYTSGGSGDASERDRASAPT
jgi:hypothetical protein